MSTSTSKPTLTILPNPALKGGDVIAEQMASSAKQTLYAEKRRLHTEQWWNDNRKWLEERGLTEHDGPLMGDRD